MELIDRYLQAVKFWLPKNQKQDIIAELSEDLRSQVEDREAELGRKLNESEIADLLKQRGRPILVANRYRPQQHLIGPVLFPIYEFVLEIVAAFYLVPWILVWIAIAIFRPRHPGQSFFTMIALFWTSFWPMAFFMIGSITTVFAVLERVQQKSNFMERWEPGKLPPVRNPNQIKRSASVAELVANSVFGVWWWVTYLSSSLILNRPEVQVLLTPRWRFFFWGFLCVTLANIALSAANLARPYWTGARATVRLATDCAGAALFCWLMKANIIAQITVPNVSAARTSEITNAINLWMDRAFPIAVLIGVGIAAGDLYRIYRVKKNGRPVGQDLAAALV